MWYKELGELVWLWVPRDLNLPEGDKATVISEGRTCGYDWEQPKGLMIKPILLWMHTLCTSCLSPKGQQLFSTSVSLMILETLWWYCMCLSMCLWTLVHLCVCVSLSICVTVCIYFSSGGLICVCICLWSVFLSVCLSCMYQSVWLCLHVCVHPCVVVCMCVCVFYLYSVIIFWLCGAPEPIFLARGLQCWVQNQLPLMSFGVRAALCVDIVLKSMFG